MKDKYKHSMFDYRIDSKETILNAKLKLDERKNSGTLTEHELDIYKNITTELSKLDGTYKPSITSVRVLFS